MNRSPPSRSHPRHSLFARAAVLAGAAALESNLHLCERGRTLPPAVVVEPGGPHPPVVAHLRSLGAFLGITRTLTEVEDLDRSAVATSWPDRSVPRTLLWKSRRRRASEAAS